MALEEYGGYIEFETYHNDMLHSDAIALNCGRNCLAYLIETKQINKIYLPYFLCSSVVNVCKKAKITVESYSIKSDFTPDIDFKLGAFEYLYIVNYYGQISNDQIKKYHEKYKNIIIDNAQSYFQEPVTNIDTIYTCRKYFGVADGAFLYTNINLKREIPIDESFSRMKFLLGRYERGANDFYSEYVRNNSIFINEQIKEMSKLTSNLLRGIDYQSIGEKRKRNFEYLHKAFCDINKLTLQVPYGAFMYPLYIPNGDKVRKILQQKKIYIPTLWPDVFNTCEFNTLEYDMALNILPIVVDQRYDLEDMDYIIKEIKLCID